MRDNDSIPNQWKKNQAASNQISAVTRGLSNVQRQVNILRRRIVGGGVASGNWRWAAAGRIYSKDNSYSGDATSGELVEVAPDDPVVTIGVTDPDTNLTVKSYPGIYITLKSVAPIPDESNPGQFKYHIPLPSLPVPVSVSQTDYDDKNYWRLISPAANCLV